MKFFVFIGALVAFVICPSAFAEEIMPGDRGYQHTELHKHYQKLFSEGRCSCRVGECRPTNYRMNNSSPSGYQVVVNREWINVPLDALMWWWSVPPALWVYEAHVCAYREGGTWDVECVVINGGV